MAQYEILRRQGTARAVIKRENGHGKQEKHSHVQFLSEQKENICENGHRKLPKHSYVQFFCEQEVKIRKNGHER